MTATQEKIDAKYGAGCRLLANGSIFKDIPAYPGSKKTRSILVGNIREIDQNEQQMMDTGYGKLD